MADNFRRKVVTLERELTHRLSLMSVAHPRQSSLCDNTAVASPSNMKTVTRLTRTKRTNRCVITVVPSTGSIPRAMLGFRWQVAWLMFERIVCKKYRHIALLGLLQNVLEPVHVGRIPTFGVIGYFWAPF